MEPKDVRKAKRESEQKNLTASFLTDDEIRHALLKTAREKNLSVSYVIEQIVSDYFKKNKNKSLDEKRRRFERKSTSFSCFIGGTDTHASDLIKATILDISHGGLRVSIPKGSAFDVKEIYEETFAVIFSLPNFNWPVRLECRPQRVFDHEDEVHIGAAIVNPDCSVCLALQQCMV
jgi:hypothetical protein